MIGQLPKELNVNGKKLAIRSDFRVALLIFTAYNDVELIENEVMQEKTMTMLNCLYENFSEIPYEDYPEGDKARYLVLGWWWECRRIDKPTSTKKSDGLGTR